MKSGQLSLELVLALAVVLGLVSFYLLNVTQMVERQKTFSEAVLNKVENGAVAEPQARNGTGQLSISFLNRGCSGKNALFAVKLTNPGSSIVYVDLLEVDVTRNGSLVKKETREELQVSYIETVELGFEAERGAEYTVTANASGIGKSWNIVSDCGVEEAPVIEGLNVSFEPVVYRTCRKDPTGRCVSGDFVKSVPFEKEVLAQNPEYLSSAVYSASGNGSWGDVTDPAEWESAFRCLIKCGQTHCWNVVNYSFPQLDIWGMRVEFTGAFQTDGPCYVQNCWSRFIAYVWNFSGKEWARVQEREDNLYQKTLSPNFTLNYSKDFFLRENGKNKLMLRFNFSAGTYGTCGDLYLKTGNRTELRIRTNGSEALSWLNEDAGAGFVNVTARAYGNVSINASVGLLDFFGMGYFPLYVPAGEQKANISFENQAGDLESAEIYESEGVYAVGGLVLRASKSVYGSFAFAVYEGGMLSIGKPFSYYLGNRTEMSAIETSGCVKPSFVLPVRDAEAGFCNFEGNSFSEVDEEGFRLLLLMEKNDVWNETYGVEIKRIGENISVEPTNMGVSVEGVSSAINSLQLESETGYYDLYNPSGFDLIVLVKESNSSGMLNVPAGGSIRRYAVLISSEVVGLVKK